MIRKELELAGLELILIRKNIKNIHLRFSKSSEITMTVPLSTTEQRIDEALLIKRDWILKYQQIIAEKESLDIIDPKVFPLMGKDLAIEYDPSLENQLSLEFEAGKLRTGIKNITLKHRSLLYAAYANKYLKPRVYEFAQKYGFRINEVNIRGQKTLWGTCSRRGNISLNWKLLLAPEFVVDYLIFHELLHTRHHNHGAQYKKELRQLFPRTDEAELWLKQHSQILKVY